MTISNIRVAQFAKLLGLTYHELLIYLYSNRMHDAFDSYISYYEIWDEVYSAHNKQEIKDHYKTGNR